MDNSFDHDKVESVRIKRVSGELVIDFPMDSLEVSDIPEVTLITVTRNRRKFAQIMIDNWKRIYYPENKVFWLVVDDSDDIKMGPIMELKSLNNKNITYYYMPPITTTNEDGIVTKKGNPIGSKRNLAMTLVKTDYVCWLDDDDFLYKDSIISRVCSLKFYGKECVYSSDIGVYNTRHGSSYILEGFRGVPEGSMLHTKKFWENNHFSETSSEEGMGMVTGRELVMLKIPYFFNFVVIDHNSNTTGQTRYRRIKRDRSYNNKASVIAPMNFEKIFPQSFKDALSHI